MTFTFLDISEQSKSIISVHKDFYIVEDIFKNYTFLISFLKKVTVKWLRW